ncbi:MAG: hypothetical protein M0Z66_07355 [Thermaerobacter sp.]|nr:hypothetical protein [Thermaerobacter sp.]
MARFENTFPPYEAFGSRTLSLQSPNLRGTDVTVAQAVYNPMLTAMNPPERPMGSPITVDGIFGPQTQGALRDGSDAGVHPRWIALAAPGAGPRGDSHRHGHQPAEPLDVRFQLRPLLVHDPGRTRAPDGRGGARLRNVAGRALRTDMVVPFPPSARIFVQAGDHAEPNGPVVLSGTLADCTLEQ